MDEIDKKILGATHEELEQKKQFLLKRLADIEEKLKIPFSFGKLFDCPNSDDDRHRITLPVTFEICIACGGVHAHLAEEMDSDSYCFECEKDVEVSDETWTTLQHILNVNFGNCVGVSAKIR